MSFDATVYRIFIASPGDVADERNIVVEVIHNWNLIHSYNKRIILLPIRWETNAVPDLSNRPQGIINSQIVKVSDALIGLFWTRLGTPTGVAASGTVEEINQFIASDRRSMLYFSNRPVELNSVDMDQYNLLKQFKKSVNGLYFEFDSSENLRDLLTNHVNALADHLISLKPNEEKKNFQGDFVENTRELMIDIPHSSFGTDFRKSFVAETNIRVALIAELEQNVSSLMALRDRIYKQNPESMARIKLTSLTPPNWITHAYKHQPYNLASAFSQDALKSINTIYSSLDRVHGIRAEMFLLDKRLDENNLAQKDVRARGFSSENSMTLGLEKQKGDIEMELRKLQIEFNEICVSVQSEWNSVRHPA